MKVISGCQTIHHLMALRKFGGKGPQLAEGTYVDSSAQVIGDVRLKEGASVWPGAVIRADDDYVEIGRNSAVMDAAFVEAPRGMPVVVGNGCLVSHSARLHGCRLEDETMIGIGAIILDGAIIGTRSIIAAGSLIAPGTRIPSGSVVVGSPGKVTRQTTAADIDRLRNDLKNVARKVKVYKDEG
jgi:carbonic anhydrase/acetyltransferase-like protein (isoleucine patch superfamily)